MSVPFITHLTSEVSWINSIHNHSIFLFIESQDVSEYLNSLFVGDTFL